MINKDILIEKDDLLEQLLNKRYLVGVPRNDKDLRVQYPELFEFPEFRRDRLRDKDDLAFVWWYRCASSPYYDVPDEKKLEKCINRAYRSETRRAAKLDEFRNLRFPDELKAAFRRMESINVGVRVENYVRLIRLRQNIHEMLDVDVSALNEEQKNEWTKRAPALWKLLQETQVTMERGAFGVTEAEKEDDGDDSALRDFRNELN